MTGTEPLPQTYRWRITRFALVADVIAAVCLALPAVLIVTGNLPTDSILTQPILIGVPGLGLLVGTIGEMHESHEKTMHQLEQDET